MKTQTKGSSSMDSSNTDSNPHRTNSNTDSNPQDSNSMDSNPHHTGSNNMVSNPHHMGSNSMGSNHSMDSLSCSTWVLDYVLLPYSLTPSLLGSSAVSLERFCAMLQASQEQS